MTRSQPKPEQADDLHLFVESLESRQMLAGIVNMSINGGGGIDEVENRDLLGVGGTSNWISIDDV